MKCDVVSLDNKKSGSIRSRRAVFGLESAQDLLARMVNMAVGETPCR